MFLSTIYNIMESFQEAMHHVALQMNDESRTQFMADISHSMIPQCCSGPMKVAVINVTLSTSMATAVEEFLSMTDNRWCEGLNILLFP